MLIINLCLKSTTTNNQNQNGVLLIRGTEGAEANQRRDRAAVAQRQTGCQAGAQAPLAR